MARNCQEAVELAQQQLPDLIFMDIKMPVMDGFEATRKIKSMEPTRHIPGIAANSQTFGGNPARPPI